MKLFLLVCSAMILALSGVVARTDGARVLDAGRHPFVNGALSVEIPAGGVDRTDDVLASTSVSGFRYLLWPERGLWVGSAAMPAFVMRGLIEGAQDTSLSIEEVELAGGHAAHLFLRDNVGFDGVADAWGLVVERGDAAYELNVGFRDAVEGERTAARVIALSTRFEN